MKTAVFVFVALWATHLTGTEAVADSEAGNKESLISLLLQAPPVAEAACFMRDVNSVAVIVDRICDCDGETVACDVGPVEVGDIELTFCNKKRNQPVEDLLVMKFACNISDPTCGEGTACDIGPLRYNENTYYLCTYQTGILPSPEGAGICHPAGNRNEGPDRMTRRPNTTTTTTTTTATTTTAATATTTAATTTRRTTTTSSTASSATKSRPTVMPTLSPDQTVTYPPPTIRTRTSKPPTWVWPPAWRPVNPPTWAWPPRWRPVSPPRPRPPILPPRWQPVPWGGMPGGRWGMGHGRQWGHADDSHSWDVDDRVPCRSCGISWSSGTGRGIRGSRVRVAVGGWLRNRRRSRSWDSSSSSSSSSFYW